MRLDSMMALYVAADEDRMAMEAKAIALNTPEGWAQLVKAQRKARQALVLGRRE